MPARAGFSTTTWAYINLESNIKDARKYLRKLRTQAFQKARKRQYEQETRVNALQQGGRNIVWSLVYEVHENKNRTFDLYRSIRAAAGVEVDGTEAGIALYSDPEIAPSKSDPSLSYAAFFLSPIEFRSFIPPRGEQTIVNYRPFFGAWQTFMQLVCEGFAVESTLEALEQLMPESLK